MPRESTESASYTETREEQINSETSTSVFKKIKISVISLSVKSPSFIRDSLSQCAPLNL